MMKPSYGEVLGVEYCTGYVDDQGQWKKGFYCPKKADGTAHVEKSKDIFCCGSQTSKYCCEKKEGFTTTSSGYYVSFSTMVSVTSVAFILAVLLTALAFICCKRYWKDRDDRNLEYHEQSSTHFYRMACSSTSEATLVNSNGGPYSFTSDHSTLPRPLNTHHQYQQQHHSDLLNSYRAAAAARHVISTSTSSGRLHQDLNGISVIELPGYPPPPYRSRTSINLDTENNTESINHMNHMNHSNTLQVVTSAIGDHNPDVHNTDEVRPTSAIVVRKPFWRKLSQ